MAKTNNSTSKNTNSNKASNQNSTNDFNAKTTRKIPTYTSGLPEESRERRDGPGGN